MRYKSLIQQGKDMLKWWLFCVCLCAMPMQGMAQDNVMTGNDEEPVFKADNFGFNAIDLRQGRFLYRDSLEYNRKRFYDHMSVGIVWHYDKIHERIVQGYDASLNYGFFVEKELNKNHALRLLFYNGTYQQTARSIRLNKYQMELLHSFNWTRFFGGYNPYRRVEAVTSLGVGGFISDRLDDVEYGGMLIAGAGARVLLSPLFMLGVEPYVALANDGIDHSGALNYRKYDVLYGTDVTLSYTFHNELSKEERKTYRGNAFVDFGLGAQFQPVSGYIPSDAQGLPLFSTVGPNLKLGLGYWISPGMALRATGNLSSSNWSNTHIEESRHSHHPAYDVRLKNVLANARLDFLINPYYFFTGNDFARFDVNAIVGWEYGRMIKTAYSPGGLLRTNYDGFSGGLQLRYNYDRYTALYLEPRLTLANYTIPYQPPYEMFIERYRDYLFSMTAGLEFATNEHRFSGRKQQPSKFAPYMAVSLQGGPNYMFVTREHAGQPYMDYSAGLAVEMQVTPYSGVRVMGDYSQVSTRDIYHYTQQMLADKTIQLADTALAIGRYGYMNFSADYVFDLGTLLQGYNKANDWDVALAFGPVYSRRVSRKAIVSKDEMLWEYRGEDPVATVPEVDHSRAAESSLGVQFGIPVSYRITPRLDVLFEPRARFFPRDYIASSHSRGLTKILNAQVGLRYALNERYFVGAVDSLYFESQPGHLFTHFAMGAQTPQSMDDMGPRIEAGVGYWLNPGVGARLSLGFTSHDWRKRQEAIQSLPTEAGRVAVSKLRQMGVAGRIDLMVDPLGYLVNRYDRPVGLNLIAGWEYGMLFRANYTETLRNGYNAFSGGLQVRYNADGFRSVYLEPRYTYNMTTAGSQYSLVAGMELGATDKAFHVRKHQWGEFTPSASFALLGGVGYIYNGQEYAAAPLSDVVGGITAEYKFTPYSGVRLTGTYANYHQRGMYAYNSGDKVERENLYNYTVDYLNFGVDYLFDVTTLLQGYTPDRRWNAAVAIGPTYGVKVASSDPAARAGYAPSVGNTSHVAESYTDGALNHLWGLQAGVPVSFRVDDNWAVLVEPRVKTIFKHPFNSRTPYPLIQYDALLGAKYSPGEAFYNRIGELGADRSYRHDFVNFAVGTQYAGGTGIPFGATGGLQLGLGVGRWMNSLWGVRFGAEMAASHLRSRTVTEDALTYDRLLKSARFGARADLMVNPVAFSTRYTPKHWGTALLLGWEMGGKVDAKYTESTARFYSSLSLGAQLRYHTSERHAIYFEPRYAFADRLVSFAAGMEFATTEYRFRSSKNQPGEFKPYYSVGLAGGVDHLFLPSLYAGMPQLGGLVGLSGEYHFTPYSGARLTLDCARLRGGMPYGSGALQYGTTRINTGIDYMLDLSTFLAGYTPDRRMDVSFAAGVVFSGLASTNNQFAGQLSKCAVGLQVGIPVQYRLNGHWGISLEPRAQVFGRNYAAPYRHIDGVLAKIFNLQMGIKYTF